MGSQIPNLISQETGVNEYLKSRAPSLLAKFFAFYLFGNQE